MKRVLLVAALLTAGVAGVQGVSAQEKVNLDMTGRIRAEAFNRSQVFLQSERDGDSLFDVHCRCAHADFSMLDSWLV